MNSSVNKALIFQGGGSLPPYSRAKGMGNEPIFHIIAGTSTGAMNAAVLVSYVKENKTWEGSDERLVEFWEYLSTQSSVEKCLTLPTTKRAFVRQQIF
jgi:NTE family protein